MGACFFHSCIEIGLDIKHSTQLKKLSEFGLEDGALMTV